jgi:hypothetical protein
LALEAGIVRAGLPARIRCLLLGAGVRTVWIRGRGGSGEAFLLGWRASYRRRGFLWVLRAARREFGCSHLTLPRVTASSACFARGFASIRMAGA